MSSRWDKDPNSLDGTRCSIYMPRVPLIYKDCLKRIVPSFQNGFGDTTTKVRLYGSKWLMLNMGSLLLALGPTPPFLTVSWTMERHFEIHNPHQRRSKLVCNGKTALFGTTDGLNPPPSRFSTRLYNLSTQKGASIHDILKRETTSSHQFTWKPEYQEKNHDCLLSLFSNE